jgi:ribosomal protein S18 acetylase RimI-like enzyme
MISKATIADVSELNILVNSAYRGDSSKKGWTTEADLLGGIRIDEKGLTAIIGKKNSFILKYTENDRIIASVMLENQQDQLYLGMLTVSPELQGGGIGKKLLKAAEEVAKELNLTKISMTVISVRSELIAWYKRHGYQTTGQTKPFPMNDPNFGLPTQFLEFIVMEKTI